MLENLVERPDIDTGNDFSNALRDKPVRKTKLFTILSE